MKRIALFLATNLAIVLVLSVMARALGLEPYLEESGLNLGALLAFMTHPPLEERIAALEAAGAATWR